MPSKVVPDVYIRPAVKSDDTTYWEYALCYGDNIFSFSVNPEVTMKGIQVKFNLKDDEIEQPKIYLGATLSNMINQVNNKC